MKHVTEFSGPSTQRSEPKVASLDVPDDPWKKLRGFTRARIGLGRCGDSLPTEALLRLELDHIYARAAIYRNVDFAAVASQLGTDRLLQVHSAAADRVTYVRRPDLGRRLNDRSRTLLQNQYAPVPWDVVFVIADGLSSVAVNDHAAATLVTCMRRLSGWTLAPIILATGARVALGDEISVLLNADLCVVLIGERPGLSVANSLGIYLTWRPRIGHRDADRNCVSNIHADGLSYNEAADKVFWLLSQARQRRLTGIALKEGAARRSLLPDGHARLEDEE
jgi:ethanolamine ammonia-lyase small subunit